MIKFDVKDSRFHKQYEPYLHFVPNFLAFFSSIFLLFSGYFNYAGNGCWIAASPTGCEKNADVDCTRG